jgi:hypothetical protein
MLIETLRATSQDIFSLSWFLYDFLLLFALMRRATMPLCVRHAIIVPAAMLATCLARPVAGKQTSEGHPNSWSFLSLSDAEAIA